MEQKLTVRELLELDELDQIESSYSVKAPVVGLDMVRKGYRPLYTVTVYQLTNDDTSGVAGMLFPNGEFIPVHVEHSTQRYWEFDETLEYKSFPNLSYSEINPGETRVQGNSWREGEVLWDGIAALIDTNIEMETEVHVNSRQQDKGTLFNKTFKQKVVVHIRREDRNAVTRNWATTGELQRAIEQGVSMRQRGRMPGMVHVDVNGDTLQSTTGKRLIH